MQHFDWSTNTLFFEEIPNAKDESRTVFFLGGKDAIVDAHVSYGIWMQSLKAY